jgi:transcriptional regulator with XRE-family HTH domain
MMQLKQARKEKGLSVAELARRTGLHPTTIFELEAGRRWPWPKYQRLLSHELGYSAAALFGEAASTATRDGSSGIPQR